MKSINLIVLSALLFCGSTQACMYDTPSIDERFYSSEYVFSALITGAHFVDYENVNKSLIVENSPEIGDLAEGGNIDFNLLPIQVFKGETPPKKIMFSFCGSGKAEVKEKVIVFVTKSKLLNRWFGYFIPMRADTKEWYSKNLARIKELAH